MSWVQRCEHEELKERMWWTEQTVHTQGEQVKTLENQLNMMMTIMRKHMPDELLLKGAVLLADAIDGVMSNGQEPKDSKELTSKGPSGGGYEKDCSFQYEEAGVKPKLPQPAQGTVSMTTEEFAAEHGLDADCRKILNGQSYALQQYVIHAGLPQRCAKPSAFIKATIRKTASRFDVGPSHLGDFNRKLEQYLVDNGIDAQSVKFLRAQTSEIQAAVMSRGPLRGRNPSAMLMAIIKKLPTNDGGCLTHCSSSQEERCISHVSADVDENCGATCRTHTQELPAAAKSTGPVAGGSLPGLVMRSINQRSRWADMSETCDSLTDYPSSKTEDSCSDAGSDATSHTAFREFAPV